MTLDTPARGVVIAQPARGFRYGSDAMWLVGFALASGPRPRDALDLGTGSGVVAALLAAHGIPARGVDSRSEWAPLWRETLARTHTPAALSLELLDVTGLGPTRYDLVVANPPYFAVDTGPTAPDPWKRAARTESTATLADFVSIGLRACAPAGRLCVVVPREREEEVLAAAGLPARRVRVGRRRTLVCVGAGHGLEELDERHPTVSGWVELATRPDPASAG